MSRPASLLLAVAFSTALAADMRGRFGMGVGWTSDQSGFAPSYAVTKIGLSERLVLEPTLNLDVTSVTKTASYNYFVLGIEALFCTQCCPIRRPTSTPRRGWAFLL